MRAAQLLTLAVLLGASCTSELELALDGKSCREAEPRCVRGYTCDVESNLCVLPAQRGGLGGAGGQGGSEPGGGGVSAGGIAGRVEGGGGPGAGAAGTPDGTGGSQPGAVDGGAGGEDDGSDAVDGGCTPVVLYRDSDGDGVGYVAQSETRCPADGWVTEPGDCRDDLPDVYPGQMTFFADPYADPLQPAANNESYDFDCDGSELSAPSNSPSTQAPETCGGIAGCQGSGYLPTSPLRTGTGVEPRCGSNRRRTCVSDGLLGGCATDEVDLADTLIFRCK